MKITVCIASRERPAALIGVVMALHRMQSGANQLDFVLGLDEDDAKTQKHLDAFEGEVRPLFTVGTPPLVRGVVENRMISVAHAAAADIDAITLMSDRTFNITPAWDSWLASAVEAKPNRVLWWQCPEDPGCIIPIIPRAYLEAAEWRWSPQLFPFWWDDTWHQEIDLMIHGPKSQKARCTYSGVRGSTNNGREFSFWLDVFCRTRARRRAIAARIAEALKVPYVERPDVDNYFASYDQQMRGRCADFEERFGDKRPPPERYLAAKAEAEQLLAELGQ